MNTKQNIVWVTGASSGIGRSISHEFNSNGESVAISARRVEELKKLNSDLTDKSNPFLIIPLDVSNSTEVNEAAKKIVAENNISCLINNAGVTSFTPAVDDSLEDIDEIIKTNLLGAIYSIKSVLPGMIENKSGVIINIISVAAIKIFKESSTYAASKAGLLAYTKVLREEVRDKNIRIINILPGATKTPIWPNQSLEKFADRMMSPDELAKFLYQVYSIKSNLVPEEIVIRPVKGDL